jgi:hypothetical protein
MAGSAGYYRRSEAMLECQEKILKCKQTLDESQETRRHGVDGRAARTASVAVMALPSGSR